MSDKEPAHVTVRILEKEYFVSCPQDERADLLDSAEFLNKKMREIRDTGKVVGADRIAVMAALNMANELLRLRRQDADLQGNRQRARQEHARARRRCASAHPSTRPLKSSSHLLHGRRRFDGVFLCGRIALRYYAVAFLHVPGCSRVTPALPGVFDNGSGYLSTVM